MPKETRNQLQAILDLLATEFNCNLAYECIHRNEEAEPPEVKLIKEKTKLKYSLVKAGEQYFILTKVYVGGGQHGHVRVGVLFDWHKKAIQYTTLRAFKSWFNVEHYNKLDGVVLNQTIFKAVNSTFFQHKGIARRAGVYQAMPLFGMNLKDWVKKKELRGIPFYQRCSVAIACVLAVKTFHATAHRDKNGSYHYYTHGDIKLDNFVFSLEEKKIYLIDYDFALKVNQSIPHGRLAGTPYYMPPELISKDGRSKVRQQSDYYALAAVIGEILGDKYKINTSSQYKLVSINRRACIDYLEKRLLRYEQLEQGWLTLFKREKHAKAHYIKQVLIPKLKREEDLSVEDYEWIGKHTGIGAVFLSGQQTKTSAALQLLILETNEQYKSSVALSEQQYPCVFKEKRKAKLNGICVNEQDRLEQVMTQPLIFVFEELKKQLSEKKAAQVDELIVALSALGAQDLSSRSQDIQLILTSLKKILKTLYEQELAHHFLRLGVGAQWAELMVKSSSCKASIVEVILDVLEEEDNIPFILLHELKNQSTLIEEVNTNLSPDNQYYPILVASVDDLSRPFYSCLSVYKEH